MKIVEIIRFGKEVLKTMSDYGVKDGDWRYIDLYDEYREMRRKGFKYRFVIMQLSLTHSISKSKIERIIRRLNQDVK